MYLDAADEAALLKSGLGEAMHARGVKIMAYDHNTDQPMYPMRVLQGAPAYTDIAAWHCYQSPVANYTVMENWHYAYPDHPQFMTECSTYLPEPGTFNFGVAQNFLTPVRHGASGASMWVMATDPDFGPHSSYGGCDGCLGSIVIHNSTTYTKTNDYYMIGQFSRFIRRGAVNHRVLAGVEGNALDDEQFDIIAAQNPDMGWVVVFMNRFGSDQEIQLEFTEGYSWQGVVPNGTVVTWLLPSDQIVRQSEVRSASSLASALASEDATSTEVCATSDIVSSSSSIADSTTLVPVPNTTHTIAANSIV